LVKVHYRRGLYIVLERAVLLADPLSPPQEKINAILVSHAHSDHCNIKALLSVPNVPKLMSRATRDLIDPRRKLKNVILLEPGDTVELGNVTIEAHEAGHVLGSLQFTIHSRQSVVYTGDVNLERRVILPPGDLLKADVLIIEATYGRPEYTFPPREVLYRELLHVVKERLSEGKPLALGARKLGVAQEVTALLAHSGIAVPLVHPSIDRYNRLYEEYGVILGPYAVAEYVVEKPVPYVAPLRSGKTFPCTGWAAKYSKGLPLSSHAGFDKLVRYALESGAESIYTVYGFAKCLAKFLREEGLNAEPVPVKS